MPKKINHQRAHQIRCEWRMVPAASFASPVTVMNYSELEVAAAKVPRRVSVASIRREVKLRNAAPDLLRACQHLQKHWGKNLTQSMRLIKAAVQKATE